MSDKTSIIINSGEKVVASTPVIISASRSTDIPAFYAKWFFHRLEEGYCVWYNPFNRKPTYVSFDKCKVIVFWTKNPEPIIPFLPELDKRGIHYYFQVTLNDYEQEGFEPCVPKLSHRIEVFKELSRLIGRERVIWRFDPLIIMPNLSVRQLMAKVWHVGNQIKGFTNKLVFSFVDVMGYRKVQNNLVKETKFYNKDTVDSAEFTLSQMNEVAEDLMKMREAWNRQGWNIKLATCAEKINLDKYGIEHNRCIDGELIEQLWPEDKELMYYLHTGKLPEPNLFGATLEIPTTYKNLKDKGQRKTCGCMISKAIGMYNTCRHLCVYCYANTSKQIVMSNKDKHSLESESILE